MSSTTEAASYPSDVVSSPPYVLDELIFGERYPAVANFREDVANFRRGVNDHFGAIPVEFFDGTFDEVGRS